MSTDPLIGYSHLHATGIRTFNLLIAFSKDANHVVEEISKRIELTVIKSNIESGDLEALTEFRNGVLPALISHPHTASAFIIATGDEAVSASKVIGELLALNSSTEYLAVNSGLNEAAAVMIATAGATDLSTQSLPGLAEIPSPVVIIGYATEPAILSELIEQLQVQGIDPIPRKFSSNHHADLLTWMLEGAHAIISFTPPLSYPVGTVMTPVINIGSGSDFHSKFLGDFDLADTDPTPRIVEELLGVISRVRTFSEYTKTVIPISPVAPVLADASKPIGLVVLNEALMSLAQDLQSHFHQVDLLAFSDDWRSAADEKDLLIFLTSGSKEELATLSTVRLDARIISLSDEGSLGNLAQAVAQVISQ